jgi:hypothetical protein
VNILTETLCSGKSIPPYHPGDGRTQEDSSMPRIKKTKTRGVVTAAPRDLSKGVIVVLSGGGFDGMNPVEVRDRMDQYIADVNADPFVQANTGGQGLKFKLLPNQKTKHLHQAKWRPICAALGLLGASPLILVGHSNGGAAAMDLARCVQSQGKPVDLVFSADSVLTLDDIGDINQVPPNVQLNFNPYVIPTPAWLLAPFPIGKRNRRQADSSLDGILNIGLTYNLPGALAHRNAFYELAGGDKKAGGGYKFPHLLLDVTLAVLRGESNFDIFHAAEASLQALATKAHIDIKIETTNFKKTLHP